MAYDLKIKNIGKLTDAKIRIGRFTVFAGPNNTGKSFVSKVMYSLFDAMNANHAEVYINNLTEPLMNGLKRLIRWDGPNENPVLYSLVDAIEELEKLVKNFPVDNSENLEEIIPDLARRTKDIRNKVKEARAMLLSQEPASKRERARFPSSLLRDSLKVMDKAARKLQESLTDVSAEEITTSGIEHKIREGLIQNFQVSKLSDLRGLENAPSEIHIENLGEFKFSNGEIEFEIGRSGLRQLQHLSNVIYLESPIHWKLKNALEIIRIGPRYLHSRRTRLSGVPEYFYDLMNLIRYDYTGDMAFHDLYEKLTGKDVLGGKLVISETGELLFRENERNFSLHVTATGIANLGMLALLIERKVLDEESFLFIDEPEAHLHPAWQVFMAEALFELAKGGVNVVIATHSTDILKWLEVHIKKNPDDKSLVALNKFPAGGNDDDDQDFDDKMATIMAELTTPFADLYTAGL